MSISIPQTCKAVVLDSPRAPWLVKEIQVKQPKEGEILIKSLACGVCHSDLATRNGDFDSITKYPIVPGHEVLGDVVAIGANVKGWKLGDRAGGAWHGGNDGNCKACSRGLPQVCKNLEVNGVTRDGGFSEYCTLRADAAVPVPKDVDPISFAPLLCAGITVFNAIRKSNVPQGDTIAISGVGGLGHLAIQYARLMGYRTVAISETEDKREAALSLGAHKFINSRKEDPVEELQKDGGASLIINFVARPEVVQKLVKGVSPGGSILLIAPVDGVSLDFIKLIVFGVSVRTWSSGFAPETREAIDFAINQGVNCLTKEFSLDEVEAAFAAMEDRTIRFRPVIKF
ncbi:alcohol dehydrogenase [Aspergillus saccharolyticus JOP 1030-1]|uniref:Alcohol dehydrogenase n=1 Tax=Aspergillus saccharolyticus JOP 1030-1 TaxID=1450539 RepID=A0A319AA91_9EURO|nr:alcohol dehydrogenase [Aspergillus saccharolyticus JOP 1030-1]PYH48548.1 alcohol dehydrogenase [Aspergillus saccharolyticus JOP 1030-1]